MKSKREDEGGKDMENGTESRKDKKEGWPLPSKRPVCMVEWKQIVAETIKPSNRFSIQYLMAIVFVNLLLL